MLYDKKMVFISGLHRSGTSILHRVISASKDVSGFSDTGAFEDEGQHLQTVFRPAFAFGGAGKFAFNPAARLDEQSELVSVENKTKLLSEWSPYWDENCPVWVEKSPPNLLRLRFLQALFPNAYFVTIIRHPVAVALATQKWSKTSWDDLIHHWIVAHQIHQADRSKIKRELCFSYEYMTSFPNKVILELEQFLGITIAYEQNFVNKNEKYFQQWESVKPWQLQKKIMKQKSVSAYEAKVNKFGYSLVNLATYPSKKI